MYRLKVIKNEYRVSISFLLLWILTCSFRCHKTQALSTRSIIKPQEFVQITKPVTWKDFDEMSALLVGSFDKNQNWISSYFAKRTVLKQYVENSKKLKGAKYTLLIAKINNRVMGMAELGISSHYISSSSTTTTTSKDNVIIKGATIGVLCVDKSYQKRGLGKILVNECERLVRSKEWGNQTQIYAAVESTNTPASEFFQCKCGYQLCLISGISEYYVDVRVRSGTTYEERPHLLLCKDIDAIEMNEDSQVMENSEKTFLWSDSNKFII